MDQDGGQNVVDSLEPRERLPEIIEYLRANPMRTVEEGGTHYHIHMPAPAPPPPPPKPTVAEQVVPWLWVALLSCIIGTICAFILAVVMVALLLGLIGAALLAAVLAYLVRTTRESQINSELAHAVARPSRRNR